MLMNIKGLNGEEHQRKAWILSEQPLYSYISQGKGEMCATAYMEIQYIRERQSLYNSNKL